MERRKQQANHVQHARLGGRRFTALVVLPADWKFEPDETPKTRADCPPCYTAADTPTPGRLCPHIHCTHNLWLVAGADRPGRRWKGSKGNSTVSMHTPHNCELDYLEAARGNALPPAVVAEALGISDRQVRRKGEIGREKLKRDEAARQALKEMVEK